MTAGTRPSYLQDMADVERRLRDVERSTARIPARLGGGGGGGAGWSPAVLTVLGGNDLTGGGVGIKKAAGRVDPADITGKDPGVRASVGAVTVSAGAVTAVAAPADAGTNRGTVYDSTQVGASCVVAGGGGTGCVVTIASVSGGKVTGYAVTNGGSGYTSAPTITPPHPTGTPIGLPWVDGLGYGTLNDGQRVLIVLDERSPIPTALPSRAQVPLWRSESGLYFPFWY